MSTSGRITKRLLAQGARGSNRGGGTRSAGRTALAVFAGDGLWLGADACDQRFLLDAGSTATTVTATRCRQIEVVTNLARHRRCDLGARERLASPRAQLHASQPRPGAAGARLEGAGCGGRDQ